MRTTGLSAAAALFLGLLSCGDPKPDDTGSAECEATTEVPYDGLDQDCDGVDLTDVDDDGYDSAAVAGGTDCDDEDHAINPGATETCSGVDDDCDGLVDDDDDSVTGRDTWYADNDSDGYGDAAAAQPACEIPSGYVQDNADCDDSDAAIHPGAAETCDGQDQDCDDEIDEDALDATDWYADADSDGYGDPDTTVTNCEAPPDHVADDADCDDTDSLTHPGAEELDDGKDNDCDGVVDVEICGDGLDNEEDGLVDCEDGDCAEDTGCTEQGYCTDTSDNDDDGLTDCDDDDCWGDCAAAPYRARVLGGAMRTLSKSRRETWMRSTQAIGTVASAWGTLRVLPETFSPWTGAPYWTSSATVATCQWSVARASMQFSTYYHVGTGRGAYTLHPTVRTGFFVESGCGWTTSGFLPHDLAPDGPEGEILFSHSAAMWMSVLDWYAGSVVHSWHSPGASPWSASYSVELGSSGDSYPPSWFWY